MRSTTLTCAWCKVLIIEFTQASNPKNIRSAVLNFHEHLGECSMKYVKTQLQKMERVERTGPRDRRSAHGHIFRVALVDERKKYEAVRRIGKTGDYIRDRRKPVCCTCPDAGIHWQKGRCSCDCHAMTAGEVLRRNRGL